MISPPKHIVMTEAATTCASDDNMFFGHVTQISSNERTRTLLLRCPTCGWLYEIQPVGSAEAQHLSEEDARERFAF